MICETFEIFRKITGQCFFVKMLIMFYVVFILLCLNNLFHINTSDQALPVPMAIVINLHWNSSQLQCQRSTTHINKAWTFKT